MISEINKEILELKERLRKHEKIESLKNMIEDELKKRRGQIIVLEDVLKSEEKDVERLEKASISSIFLTLIGQKEEKLHKEREEFLIAKLKYEDCLKVMNELEQELVRIKNEMVNHIGIQKKYNDLIKEKERLLIKEGGDLGEELKNNLLLVDELKLDIKEVKEAILAGERVYSSLKTMGKYLKSARNWGTWDMLGGGLLSDLAKHSAINDANDIAHDVKGQLQSFKKELSDVNEFTDIHVNLSSFATFADFFFDGIFADWFVQSKINDSLNNVETSIYRIDIIIEDLKRGLGSKQDKLKEIEYNIDNILA